MAAVKPMAAVAMMAGLLAGPVAAPNPRPGRPRRVFYPWHIFTDWLGHRRRRAYRGSAGTNERRRDRPR